MTHVEIEPRCFYYFLLDIAHSQWQRACAAAPHGGETDLRLNLERRIQRRRDTDPVEELVRLS